MPNCNLTTKEVHFKHAPILTKSRKDIHHKNKEEIVELYNQLLSTGRIGYQYYNDTYKVLFNESDKIDTENKKNLDEIKIYFRNRKDKREKNAKIEKISKHNDIQNLQKIFPVSILASSNSCHKWLELKYFNNKTTTSFRTLLDQNEQMFMAYKIMCTNKKMSFKELKKELIENEINIKTHQQALKNIEPYIRADVNFLSKAIPKAAQKILEIEEAKAKALLDQSSKAKKEIEKLKSDKRSNSVKNIVDKFNRKK